MPSSSGTSSENLVWAVGSFLCRAMKSDMHLPAIQRLDSEVQKV
jgi:hypothetical protein